VTAGFLAAYLLSLLILALIVRAAVPIWVWATGWIPALLGAEWCDFDHLDDNEKILSHRDIITHSAFVPLIVFVIDFLTAPTLDAHILAWFIFLFSVGVASHLILDEWPVWEKGMAKNVLGWMAEGLTGQELVKKQQGTFLIHLHGFHVQEKKRGKTKMVEKKTMSKHQSRVWYFVNGAFCFFVLALYSLRVVVPIPWLPF
jgi:hypothetical protein